VGDDFRARRREHFIVAGLIGVMVGIEERHHLPFKCSSHLRSELRRTAVHEHKSVSDGQSDRVCFTKPEDGDFVCLSSEQRWKTQRCRCREHALQ
jgi:hypothetical protein